jgi:hypothetical protein
LHWVYFCAAEKTWLQISQSGICTNFPWPQSISKWHMYQFPMTATND